MTTPTPTPTSTTTATTTATTAATTEAMLPPAVTHPLLVLICGPYLSGTDGDPAKIAVNRARLEQAALPIYERGHLPMLGEWLALPIIEAAGGRAPGDAVFAAYQYPVAHRLLERCDAVLRLPGASRGADLDVARARERGLPVIADPAELPPVRPPAAAHAFAASRP